MGGMTESPILGVIIAVIVGLACIVIGILNKKGNISMLHSYHIDNIAEEDKKPFGKMVGTGMIIVGVALIVFGGFMLISELTKDPLYTTIGTIIMAVGIVVGLAISLYSIKKYNKKIF